MTDPLATLADLSDLLGHSVDYWRRKCQKRAIPYKRIGREYRFTRDDIAQILAAAHVPPAQPTSADPLASVVTRGRKSA